MQLNEWVQSVLPKSLAEVCGAKLAQEDCLRTLAGVISQRTGGQVSDVERLLSQYHTTVSALLLTSAPQHFSGYHRHCTPTRTNGVSVEGRCFVMAFLMIIVTYLKVVNRLDA